MNYDSTADRIVLARNFSTIKIIDHSPNISATNKVTNYYAVSSPSSSTDLIEIDS